MRGLDELIESGLVRLTIEQYDFFYQPVDRLAVVTYGIPDPDRLYIAGPDEPGTIYQLAQPGEPADNRGLVACVLPVVVQGVDQEEARMRISADMGSDWHEFMLPTVLVSAKGSHWMYHWHEEEYPFAAAPWDLWPIDSDATDNWDVAELAFESSKLPLFYDLLNIWHSGYEAGPLPDEYHEVEEERYNLERRVYALENDPSADPDLLTQLRTQVEELRGKLADMELSVHAELESEITHPSTGQPDPQMPALVLPPDEAAVWSSLQMLSWRNWNRLSKADWSDSGCADRRRFIQANRRISPWY